MAWGGQFENLERATARLMIAVPVALFLIFSLLFITFSSVKLTLLIYLNVPIAATGGIFALWLRDMPFSISAGVGFIALFGIAVMNGVVLIEHIRHLRTHGHERDEAVVHGSIDRLRPVLMTALCGALGFIPMAVSGSAGAEVQRPLATVVIGGLVTCTILTLLVYRRFTVGSNQATKNPRQELRPKQRRPIEAFPLFALLKLLRRFVSFFDRDAAVVLFQAAGLAEAFLSEAVVVFTADLLAAFYAEHGPGHGLHSFGRDFFATTLARASLSWHKNLLMKKECASKKPALPRGKTG